MKIYVLTRKESGFDSNDSVMIIASNLEDAFKYHPDFNNKEFPANEKNLHVEIIGKASPTLSEGLRLPPKNTIY